MTTNPTTPHTPSAKPSPENGKDLQRKQELRNKYEPDRAPPSLRKFAKANPPTVSTESRKFTRDW